MGLGVDSGSGKGMKGDSRNLMLPAGNPNGHHLAGISGTHT